MNVWPIQDSPEGDETDRRSGRVFTSGGRGSNGSGEHSTATRGFGFREVRDFGARLDLFRSAAGTKRPFRRTDGRFAFVRFFPCRS